MKSFEVDIAPLMCYGHRIMATYLQSKGQKPNGAKPRDEMHPLFYDALQRMVGFRKTLAVSMSRGSLISLKPILL